MIHDPQLKQLFELKKSISLSAYYLGEETTGAVCLYIDYEINGEFKNIRIESIREICEILKESGLIKEYWFFPIENEFMLEYETETNTERNGECKTAYGSFADFVEQTKFSANDANEVAAVYELRKITNNQKTLV